MRTFDHESTEKELGFKQYIRVNDWELQEERRYFYNGQEVVERTSKDGNAYKVVHVYLLEELTRKEVVLEMFGSVYASSFKSAAPARLDLCRVTKVEETYERKDGTEGTGITFKVEVDPSVRIDENEAKRIKAQDELLANAKPAQPVTQRPGRFAPKDEEIDISDIPF